MKLEIITRSDINLLDRKSKEFPRNVSTFSLIREAFQRAEEADLVIFVCNDYVKVLKDKLGTHTITKKINSNQMTATIVILLFIAVCTSILVFFIHLVVRNERAWKKNRQETLEFVNFLERSYNRDGKLGDFEHFEIREGSSYSINTTNRHQCFTSDNELYLRQMVELLNAAKVHPTVYIVKGHWVLQWWETLVKPEINQHKQSKEI